VDDFTQRDLPGLGRSLFRLGLGLNGGLDRAGLEQAVEQGVQYLFWTLEMGEATEALKDLCRQQREQLCIASGPTFAYSGGTLRRYVDNALRALDTDYLDVLQMFWLGKTSRWSASTIDAMVELREQGRVKAIGVSIHDRPRAGQLAIDSPLDLLQVRYNPAHPGAERDIFPHLHHRRPALVSYTSTCWGKLLDPPASLDEPTPEAADCYRFALTSVHVDLVLTLPGSWAELEQNLEGLRQGPLDEDQLAWLRRVGDAVRGGSASVRFGMGY